MKSNYVQLNKAKPVSFKMVFERHAKISRAIHTLVKTAYLNHHLEEKNRRVELVKCLDGNASVLVEQLGDDNFKNTLKDAIQEILVKEFKVTREAKNRLVDDIECVLNEKGLGRVSVPSQTRRSNTSEGYRRRISKFCKDVLKTGHSKRMGILRAEIRVSLEKLCDSLGGMMGGFESGRRDGNGSAFSGFADYVQKRYLRLVRRLRSVKTSVMRRVRSAFTKRGVLGFIGGVVGGVNKIVTGILGGLFSLVRGIVSTAVGLVKTAFGVASKAVRGIMAVCKKIVSYVASLASGFLDRFGKFIASPRGMFIVGYVAGFIYQKMVEKYDEYKEKAEEWWKTKKKRFHEIRMGVVGYFKNTPLVMQLRRLAIAHLNMRAFREKMQKMSIQLNKFSMTGVIGGFVGGKIGAWIGRIVGGFVGTFFGPLRPIIMGAGTALGAIAGYYIGKAYGSVPEKPASERGQKNMFLAAVTNKYRQKREKRIRGIRTALVGEIDELDKKANDLSYGEAQRAEFAKRRDELKRRLDGISGTMTINDEEDLEREKHSRTVENIQKLLDLEQIREDGNSIFRVLKSGTTKEVVDFTVDSVMKQAESGKIGYNEFGLNEINVDGQRLKAYNALSRIKQNALNVAVDAYQKGMIPYSDIQPVANGLVSKYAELVKCKIKSGFWSHSGSVSLKEYILSGRNDDIDTTEGKSSELWD